MRRHPSYTYLQSAKKNGTEKMMTDKTKLVKEAKKKQIVVAGPPIKKRLGEMGLSEMKLGKMRLGEM